MYNTFTEKLIRDICCYIDYLSDRYGYHITVHDAHKKLGRFCYLFLKYDYHKCDVCCQIKNSPLAWEYCVKRRGKIYDKISQTGNTLFCGTCYAGVSEYIVPLCDTHDRSIGFLSVSGYTQNLDDSMKRALAACAKYNLSPSRMAQAASHLNCNLPDEKLLCAQVTPLQDLFSAAFSFNESLGLQKDGNPPVSCDEAVYQKILDSVNLMCNQPDFSLRKLSQKMNLSYTYVSRIFSKYSDVSFTHYIRRQRIESGKNYLELTEESVSSIAALSGFDDPNYFSSIFKKETGLTPLEWRKKYASESHER